MRLVNMGLFLVALAAVGCDAPTAVIPVDESNSSPDLIANRRNTAIKDVLGDGGVFVVPPGCEFDPTMPGCEDWRDEPADGVTYICQGSFKPGNPGVLLPAKLL
jgi:hypothetical protein